MRSAIEKMPREAVPFRTFQRTMSAVLSDLQMLVNDPAASQRATHHFMKFSRVTFMQFYTTT